ncbi:TPA: hypothetical protein DCY43_02260 [candidate division WWE3 bacterium]|uniref:Transcription elongation factor GreA/GreB N-terminal domain-containing protein n=2 Tax=Katanobacteria TaxID=422282 RepID=A0A351JTD2_UNCKA|nr:hypothetical protein [candidate division WWE3 bacterium]
MQYMKQSVVDLEKLRCELVDLRAQREELILELGQIAQENNDLRENSAYLHTEQKVHYLDARIKRILDVFNAMELEKIKQNTRLKPLAKEKRVDLITKI